MSPQRLSGLCHLPLDFHAGNTSPIALVQSSGFMSSNEFLTHPAVLEVLQCEPSLIDEWQTWSDDKRANQGWVFQGSKRPYEVYFFSVFGRRVDEFTLIPESVAVDERLEFTDRAEACAEFIVREIKSIAASIKKPSYR